MKKEFKDWPSIVRFFAPQIYQYNLKTFIPPIAIILFLVFSHTRMWIKGIETDIFWTVGVTMTIVLIALTVFQIGSYYWIKKNSLMELIPYGITSKYKILVLIIFVILPIVVLIFSLNGHLN